MSRSHRDYLRSGYLHHRLPVAGINHYRDNAVPTKPSATKMPSRSWRTRQLLTMQMRQRDVAALDAKYTGVS